jgi:hypothetical protein
MNRFIAQQPNGRKESECTPYLNVPNFRSADFSATDCFEAGLSGLTSPKVFQMDEHRSSYLTGSEGKLSSEASGCVTIANSECFPIELRCYKRLDFTKGRLSSINE